MLVGDRRGPGRAKREGKPRQLVEIARGENHECPQQAGKLASQQQGGEGSPIGSRDHGRPEPDGCDAEDCDESELREPPTRRELLHRRGVPRPKGNHLRKACGKDRGAGVEATAKQDCDDGGDDVHQPEMQHHLHGYAGLRAGEIAKLRWGMVLRADGRIGDLICLEAAISKFAGGRRIPLHHDLRLALVGLRRSLPAGGGAPDQPVIRSFRGAAMRANSIVNWFTAFYREVVACPLKSSPP